MFEPWRRAMRVADLMQDSTRVVTARTRLIVEAAANPLTGDYTELHRMVPEKTEAFTKAAVTLSAGMADFHSEIMGTWVGMIALAMEARLPTPVEARNMVVRTSTALQRVSKAGDKALIPIARAARSNAKRLK